MCNCMLSSYTTCKLVRAELNQNPYTNFVFISFHNRWRKYSMISNEAFKLSETRSFGTSAVSLAIMGRRRNNMTLCFSTFLIPTQRSFLFWTHSPDDSTDINHDTADILWRRSSGRKWGENRLWVSNNWSCRVIFKAILVVVIGFS